MIRWRQNIMGLAALFIGAGALVLGILTEGDRMQIERAAREKKSDKGFILKFRGFGFSFGRKSSGEQARPEPLLVAGVRPLMLATITAGVIGLVVGAISWAREREPRLSGVGMGLCAAGLFWHYLVLAVAAAVAIVVIFSLLANGP